MLVTQSEVDFMHVVLRNEIYEYSYLVHLTWWKENSSFHLGRFTAFQFTVYNYSVL